MIHWSFLSQILCYSSLSTYTRQFGLISSNSQPFEFGPQRLGNYAAVVYMTPFPESEAPQEHVGGSTRDTALTEHGLQVTNSDINMRAVCSTAQGVQEVLELVMAIANRQDYQRTHTFPMNASCIVEDFTQENVWLISDAVGQTPLWYSFANTENSVDDTRILITTDFLYGQMMANFYPDLTALSPGSVMMISMRSYEIEYLEKWNVPPQHLAGSYQLDKHSLSYKMYSRSLDSLIGGSIEDSPRQFFNDHLMTEYDPMDISSALNECIFNSLAKSHIVFQTNLLTGYRAQYQEDYPFSKIFDFFNVIEQNKEQRSSSLFEMASERYELCKAAKLNNISKIVSFDNGLKFRPVKVFFQNLFCSLLGVQIVYPYDSFNFQEQLTSLDFSTSDLHQVVDHLHSVGVCNVSLNDVRSMNINIVGDSIQPLPSGSSAVANSMHHIHRTCKGSCNRSRLASLWLVARQHASNENFLFVLMATSGYKDMLANFLCSATSPVVNSRHLLIVTPNQDIVDLAISTGVGYFMSKDNKENRMFSGNYFDTTSSDGNLPVNYLPFADFGTLKYQELMLLRTELVLDLLLLEYQPIIADIDTVWRLDPLSVLRDPLVGLGTNDIAVTNDHGEICGCFVALSNSVNAINFWRTVATHHFNLIERSRKGNNSLARFSDSEQKIMTALLVERRYTGNIQVKILPGALFPSGYDYFNVIPKSNLQEEVEQPAVIHNNFIIGMDIKKVRFLKRQLWTIPPERSVLSKLNKSSRVVMNTNGDLMGIVPIKNEPQCSFDHLWLWRNVFISVEKDIRIPLLLAVLPIHDSVISNSTSQMIQFSAEGLPRKTITSFLASDDRMSQNIKLWVESDPPSALDFDALGVFVLNLKSFTDLSLSAIVHESNIALSVDSIINKESFSCDRSGFHDNIAHETVLAYKQSKLNFGDDRSSSEEDKPIEDILDCSSLFGKHNMSYTIKVIAFNRPLSLSRLLKSLGTANYCGFNISMDVVVDGYVHQKDKENVELSIKIAEEFSWPFGKKLVYYRDENVGLADQWFSIWEPHDQFHAAFIFEDDIEVSPFFFQWSIRVVDKYYYQNKKQQSMHEELLRVIRSDIKRMDNILLNDSIDPEVVFDYQNSHLFNFTQQFAGDPLMYGICLQKQHLDPTHYPKKLEIRNGYRPFLYSLVGSWGPLMLPIMWHSFREWWSWRNNLHSKYPALGPITDKLVTNYFLSENPRIWTPWMVRFAYETGSKCFYSNLPDDFSLVVNHRDRGENYAKDKGKSSELVTADHFDNTKEAQSNRSKSAGIQMAILQRSVTDFPSIADIAQWQYDFRLRRAGAMFIDKTMHKPFFVPPFNNGTHSDTIFKHWQQEVEFIHNSVDYRSPIELSVEHWIAIVSLLEANFHPRTIFRHILQMTPLLPLLLSAFLNHSIVAHDLDCQGELGADTNSSAVFFGRFSPKVSSVLSHRWKQGRLDCISSDESMLSSHPQKYEPPRRRIDDVSISIIDMMKLLPSVDKKDGFRIPYSEYILTIGPCSSAPTEISLSVYEINNGHQLGLFDNNTLHSPSAIKRYTILEDICTEGKRDLGASLFVDVEFTGDKWHAKRHGIARRLQGSLISTRIVERKLSPMFT